MFCMKKILMAAVSLCAAAAFADAQNAGTMSNFSRINSQAYIKDNFDALVKYAGSWVGEQTVVIGGKERGKAAVTQRCVPLGADYPRLKCYSTITADGREVKETGTISLRDGRLMLELMSASDKPIIYEGFVDLNIVEWRPIPAFLLLDRQRDMFFFTEKGLMLVSDGKRYLELESVGFKGFFETRTFLERNFDAYSAAKMSSFKGMVVNPKVEE